MSTRIEKLTAASTKMLAALMWLPPYMTSTCNALGFCFLSQYTHGPLITSWRLPKLPKGSLTMSSGNNCTHAPCSQL